MSVKIILYVIIIPISLFALDSLNIENKFKKNKMFQARILALFLSVGLSYLVVNFLYDIYLSTKFI